jgi:hypothetical protein
MERIITATHCWKGRNNIAFFQNMTEVSVYAIHQHNYQSLDWQAKLGKYVTHSGTSADLYIARTTQSAGRQVLAKSRKEL